MAGDIGDWHSVIFDQASDDFRSDFGQSTAPAPVSQFRARVGFLGIRSIEYDCLMPCGLEMGYKKPTIIEIYIECFLAPSTLTVSRLFEIVPVLKEKGFTDIELQPSFQVATGEPNLQPRIRCWSGDRKKLIQLSQDNLVVNLVGDCPGWRAFTELLESAVSAVRNSIGEFAIVSMNLNTIDRFSVPVKSYVFDHYVNCGGKMVPEWYKGSREALDITLGRGLVKEDTWNRRINVKVRRRDPVVIEFRVGLHNVVNSGKSWKAVLETLHDESNEIFESLITDSTRSEIMGGFVE